MVGSEGIQTSSTFFAFLFLLISLQLSFSYISSNWASMDIYQPLEENYMSFKDAPYHQHNNLSLFPIKDQASQPRRPHLQLLHSRHPFWTYYAEFYLSSSEIPRIEHQDDGKKVNVVRDNFNVLHK
jgi:hypothetical protein